MVAELFTFDWLAQGLTTHCLLKIGAHSVGQPLDNATRQLCKKTVGSFRKQFGLKPPTASENHDIQRAIVMSFVRAGRELHHALTERVKLDRSLTTGGELSRFTLRLDRLLNELESTAQHPSKSPTDLSSRALVDLFVDLSAVGLIEPLDYIDATREVASRFEAFLKKNEGESLLPIAQSKLSEIIDGADNYVLFGDQVIRHFLEILKSGEYKEATAAFEYRLFGTLRTEMRALDAKLEGLVGQSATAEVTLSEIRSELWEVRNDLLERGLAVDELRHAVRDELKAERAEYLYFRGALRLDRYRVEDAEVGAPYLEMRFTQRRTAFVGRETELERLNSFLQSDTPLKWWQVSGQGGQGKSRLGLHLVDNLPPNWHGGFLSSDDLAKQDWALARFPKPTLIIVDYLAAPEKAFNFVQALYKLSRRLPDDQGELEDGQLPLESPVRFLVLERAGYGQKAENAPRGRSWYDTVQQNRKFCIVSHQHDASSLELGILQPNDMIRIANSWRANPGSSRREPLEPLNENQTKTLLTVMTGGDEASRPKAWRPLFAMMIGEQIEKFKDGFQVDTQIEEILTAALQAEREELWKLRAGNIWKPSRTAENLAFLTSMVGALNLETQVSILEGTIEDGEPDLEEFYGEVQDDDHLKHANTVLGYAAQPKRTDGRIAPLRAREPDLLAEYQILQALDAKPLSKRPTQRIARLAADAFRIAPSELIAFFVRLAEDFPNHSVTRALFGTALPSYALQRLSDEADRAELAAALDLNLPSYYGMLGLARAFVDFGADVAAPHANGAKPLLFAAQEGHTEIVTALLTAGADVNVVNPENGSFPLLIAAQKGHAEIVTALLTAEADVNLRDPIDGTFPLLMAAQKGHAEIVTALLAAEADVNLEHNETGMRAVDLVVMQQNAPIISIFADHLELSEKEVMAASRQRLRDLQDRLSDFARKQHNISVDEMISVLDPPDAWPVPNPLTLDWQRPTGDTLRGALNIYLQLKQAGGLPEHVLADLRQTGLPFYPGVQLIEFAVEHRGRDAALAVLDIGESFVHLNGTPPPIHSVNARDGVPPHLETEALAMAYLEFFCFYIQADSGSFRIVYDLEAVGANDLDLETAEELASLISAPEVTAEWEDGFELSASLIHGEVLFRSVFMVSKNGMVEMLDEDPRAGPLPAPRYWFEDGLRHVGIKGSSN